MRKFAVKTTRRPVHVGLAACLALGLVAGHAHAQMMLPGALNGNSPTAAPKPGGGGGGGEPSYTPPKPIVIKPPSEDTIVGHTLSYDGSKGTMAFERSGSDLVLSKLTLTGDKISAPGKPCDVDVPTTTPIVATPSGRPVGALRFAVAVPACPLSIDVLDGAVLVASPDASCDFTAADCRVSPGGLWGPAAADISEKQAKDLEHQRVRYETTMRANFRALVKRAGKDRAAVKAISRDQAAFSSDREMLCRDYQQETTHGFCSTQITQARVLALLAQFGDEDPKKPDHRAARKPKPKPKSAATAEPAPQPAGTPTR